MKRKDGWNLGREIYNLRSKGQNQNHICKAIHLLSIKDKFHQYRSPLPIDRQLTFPVKKECMESHVTSHYTIAKRLCVTVFNHCKLLLILGFFVWKKSPRYIFPCNLVILNVKNNRIVKRCDWVWCSTIVLLSLV